MPAAATAVGTGSGNLWHNQPASSRQIGAFGHGDCAMAGDDWTCPPLCSSFLRSLGCLPRELPRTKNYDEKVQDAKCMWLQLVYLVVPQPVSY